MKAKRPMNLETERYAAWLEKQLEKRKMSQNELAERSGLSIATVHYAVNGKREPRVSTVMRIADAFGLRMVFAPKERIK